MMKYTGRAPLKLKGLPVFLRRILRLPYDNLTVNSTSQSKKL